MSDWNTTEGWTNSANAGLNGAAAGFSVGGPIGAVVGGLGGAIGGLFGSKKSTDWNKKYFRESVRQFNIQDEYNKNRLQYTIKDAIKAGVNPLAAIGAGSGHYSPTISTGGHTSDGGDSGSGLSRTFDSIQNFIAQKQAKEDRAIALQSANLDLESKRLQNDILRQKLLTETQVGIPSFSVDHSNPLWRVPMRYSLKDAKKLMKDWVLPNGQTVSLIDPDAISDADITNFEALRALGATALNPSTAYYREDKGKSRYLKSVYYSQFPNFRRLYRYVKNLEVY